MTRRLGFLVGALLLFAAPASADTGLLGQWHFDEHSGTVAHDASIHRNTGTLIGGPAWTSGRYGGALSFNGNGAEVAVPDSSSLEPASGVTVAAWVKATAPGDYKYIVSKGASGCMTGSYGLYTGPAGGVMFYVGSNDGVSYTRSPDGGTGIWNGAWHFVAGTYDGSTVRLYLDGNQVGAGSAASGAIPYGLAAGSELLIGNYGGCGGLSFPGTIDEPNVFSGALSQWQLRLLMQCPIYGEPIALCISL